ncbi:MAG: ABC transporter substrate-binding protein [Salinarimonadaceae bacterium]|nr:MAG: ABC transporter substrate-binding protein [Salinarimonadaceae bacterium]
MLLLLAMIALLRLLVFEGEASAQLGGEAAGIPSFWDPRARVEPAEVPGGRTLRVMTADDFPPLHFGGPDAVPTGFSVELARLACERLRVTCTIQVRPFGDLLDALANGHGDVVAAAFPITAALQERFAVTEPYFRFPARFVARIGEAPAVIDNDALALRRVAVVAGSAHEAFLDAYFPDIALSRHPNLFIAQGELRRGEVDLLFGDGLTLALWIGGRDSQGCCDFAGGPYLDERYFGEGIGFVMRRQDEPLRRAFDYALQRVWEDGEYSETWLTFFPVSPF